MNRYLLAGLTLIAIANLALLGQVAWNRSGRQSTLTLSERELALTPPTAQRDNSAMTLRLQVQTLNPAGSQHHYDPVLVTGDAKLQAFGFGPGCGKPLSATPWRAAWFALELDGNRFAQQQRIDATLLQRAQQRAASTPDPQAAKAAGRFAQYLSQSFDRAHDYGSRLYITDLGPERDALAEKYAAQPNIALVPGSVTCSRGQLTLASLDVMRIHVPHRFRTMLEKLSYRSQPGAPRFTATVAFGRLGEPWIIAVKRL